MYDRHPPGNWVYPGNKRNDKYLLMQLALQREANTVSNGGRTEEQVMKAEGRTGAVENKSNDIRAFAKIQIPGHGGPQMYGGAHK